MAHKKSRRLKALVAAAGTAVAIFGLARKTGAATYTYTQTSGNWGKKQNWASSNYPDSSTSNPATTSVIFAPNGGDGSVNDNLGYSLTLNNFQSGSIYNFTITNAGTTGNLFMFTNNASTSPFIAASNSGSLTFDTNWAINSGNSNDTMTIGSTIAANGTGGGAINIYGTLLGTTNISAVNFGLFGLSNSATTITLGNASNTAANWAWNNAAVNINNGITLVANGSGTGNLTLNNVNVTLSNGGNLTLQNDYGAAAIATGLNITYAASNGAGSILTLDQSDASGASQGTFTIGSLTLNGSTPTNTLSIVGNNGRSLNLGTLKLASGGTILDNASVTLGTISASANTLNLVLAGGSDVNFLLTGNASSSVNVTGSSLGGFFVLGPNAAVTGGASLNIGPGGWGRIGSLHNASNGAIVLNGGYLEPDASQSLALNQSFLNLISPTSLAGVVGISSGTPLAASLDFSSNAANLPSVRLGANGNQSISATASITPYAYTGTTLGNAGAVYMFGGNASTNLINAQFSDYNNLFFNRRFVYGVLTVNSQLSDIAASSSRAYVNIGAGGLGSVNSGYVTLANASNSFSGGVLVQSDGNLLVTNNASAGTYFGAGSITVYGQLTLSGSSAIMPTNLVAIRGGNFEVDNITFGTTSANIATNSAIVLDSGQLSQENFGAASNSVNNYFGTISVIGGSQLLLHSSNTAGATNQITLNSLTITNHGTLEILGGNSNGAGGNPADLGKYSKIVVNNYAAVFANYNTPSNIIPFAASFLGATVGGQAAPGQFVYYNGSSIAPVPYSQTSTINASGLATTSGWGATDIAAINVNNQVGGTSGISNSMTVGALHINILNNYNNTLVSTASGSNITLTQGALLITGAGNTSSGVVTINPTLKFANTGGAPIDAYIYTTNLYGNTGINGGEAPVNMETLAGAIIAKSITKYGDGSLNITNTVTNTGSAAPFPFYVNEGLLQLGGSATNIPAANIQVAPGATFQQSPSGNVRNLVNITGAGSVLMAGAYDFGIASNLANTSISPGMGFSNSASSPDNVGILSLSAYAGRNFWMASNTTLQFDLGTRNIGTNYATSDEIVVNSGTIVLGGALQIAKLPGFGAGTYPLIYYSGGGLSFAGTAGSVVSMNTASATNAVFWTGSGSLLLSTNNGAILPAGYSFTIATTSTEVDLIVKNLAAMNVAQLSPTLTYTPIISGSTTGASWAIANTGSAPAINLNYTATAGSPGYNLSGNATGSLAQGGSATISGTFTANSSWYGASNLTTTLNGSDGSGYSANQSFTNTIGIYASSLNGGATATLAGGSNFAVLAGQSLSNQNITFGDSLIGGTTWRAAIQVNSFSTAASGFTLALATNGLAVNSLIASGSSSNITAAITAGNAPGLYNGTASLTYLDQQSGISGVTNAHGTINANFNVSVYQSSLTGSGATNNTGSFRIMAGGTVAAGFTYANPRDTSGGTYRVAMQVASGGVNYSATNLTIQGSLNGLTAGSLIQPGNWPYVGGVFVAGGVTGNASILGSLTYLDDQTHGILGTSTTSQTLTTTAVSGQVVTNRTLTGTLNLPARITQGQMLSGVTLSVTSPGSPYLTNVTYNGSSAIATISGGGVLAMAASGSGTLFSNLTGGSVAQATDNRTLTGSFPGAVGGTAMATVSMVLSTGNGMLTGEGLTGESAHSVTINGTTTTLVDPIAAVMPSNDANFNSARGNVGTIHLYETVGYFGQTTLTGIATGNVTIDSSATDGHWVPPNLLFRFDSTPDIHSADLSALAADLSSLGYAFAINDTHGLSGNTPDEALLDMNPSYDLAMTLATPTLDYGNDAVTFDFSNVPGSGSLEVYQVAVVPEPTDLSLLGLGALGLLARRRKRTTRR